MSMIVYDTSGNTPGRIKDVSSGPDPKIHARTLEAHGLPHIYVPEATTQVIFSHFVDLTTKTLVRRPSMQLSDDGSKITGIPKGTRVSIALGTIPLESEVVDDGEVEFTPNHPGVYTFSFFCWPYLPLQMQVRR